MINFFNEDVSFTLKSKNKLRQWIKYSIETEGRKPGHLNFIFCSDSYLLEINQKYLNHDTYTDIITFDTSEKDLQISGDIFISYDRICENSNTFKSSITDEIHRVIIHGTLHLIGYSDKNKKKKAEMTAKEDHYLAERARFF